MMNRRTFMGVMATVTAAGGLGFGGEIISRRRLSPKDMSSANLEPLKGHQVTMHSAEGGRTLQAVVEDIGFVRHRRRRGAPGTEQVSLLLATDGPEAPAGIYRIENRDVSLGSLYVSPVEGKNRRQRLEAVITRIV